MQDTCNICPRNCNARRKENLVGICKETKEIRIARAALHMWEEPCISGDNGSGTVFFTGCNLHCVFCQNKSIADSMVGKIVSQKRLETIFYELKEKKANNINLVTPTHFTEELIPILRKMKEEHFDLPFVYNTSGYEKVETLRKLEGLIDIYMPDLKYMDSTISFRYSNVKDYYDKAMKAIEEMIRQVGEAQFYALKTKEMINTTEYNKRCDAGEEILMKKGVIVRHLLLPGCIEDSKRILNAINNNFGDKVYVSIMNQYTPLPHTITFDELNRKVTKNEYEEVIAYAINLGIENAFIQEGDTAKESFIPDFNMEGI